MKILQLKTSIFDGTENQGVSSQLSDELVAGLLKGNPEARVVIRDFSSDPVPYLDGAWLQALATPAESRSQEQRHMAAWSDAAIAELQDADTVVIGAPMYNFSVPAMLKSWTDHVARAGVTFKYTDEGSVGLLRNKKVYVVVSTGGLHTEGVTDFMRPYLRTILGFLGLSDISVIVADGLNMGEEHRGRGLDQARQTIAAILAQGGSIQSINEEVAA